MQNSVSCTVLLLWAPGHLKFNSLYKYKTLLSLDCPKQGAYTQVRHNKWTMEIQM